MELVPVILATYYLVAAVTRTDGVWGAFYRLRTYDNLPFHCAICFAPWAAAGALLAHLGGFWLLVTVLAIAGAVTALNDLRESLLK